MQNLEIGVYYESRNKKPERVWRGGIRAAASEETKKDLT
jgi:hypothetical protein